jgi:hypothetical protein
MKQENTSVFYNCKVCDFEWHKDDGNECPVCFKNIKENITEEQDYRGGAFGSGKNVFRLNSIYKAIGLVALIFLLYQLFGVG